MSKTLTKADIIEFVYESTGRSRPEARQAVETLLSIIKQAILEEGSLLISGFGKFEAYAKAARRGRNPQTESSMMLPPRRVVVFRLSKKFRSDLNGGHAPASEFASGEGTMPDFQ